MTKHWHRVDRVIIYRITSRNGVERGVGGSDIKQGRWLSIIRPNEREIHRISRYFRGLSRLWIIDESRALPQRVARQCDTRWGHRGLLIIEVDLILHLAQDHEPDPVIGGKGNPLSTIAEPRPSRFTHVNSSGRDVASGGCRGRVTS